MSRTPQLKIIGITPQILSAETTALSPVRTPRTSLRSGWHNQSTIPFPASSPVARLSQSATDYEWSGESSVDEQAPLLGSTRPAKKPFYRARPMWLVPLVIVASLARGMTLAPRLEVFTQLACGGIHAHYNHTMGHPHHIYRPPHYPQPQPQPTTIHISTPPVIANDAYGAPEDDPRNLPSEWCMSNPAVQAGAATLQTIMTTIMGALSALTTSWWGSFGERYGRTRVIAITTLGLFLTDLTFILVSTPHTIFATHGHKFLIIAPLIEGLLGGWTTLFSATNSYLSDCTSDGSRAQIFSRFAGVTFLGLAAGPLLGAFLIQHPLKFLQDRGDIHPIQNVTSVFWVSIALSFLNLLFATFVAPESLSKAQQAANRVSVDIEVEDTDAETTQNKTAGVGFVSTLLRPFVVFMPRTIIVPGANSKKDWNLTFLALSIFASMLGSGVVQYLYMYAQHTYAWGADMLSYYISWLGGLRAVYLLFILPFIIATFKPKAKPKTTTTPAGQPAPKPKPTMAKLAKEMYFDLFLAKFSYFIEILSQVLMVVLPSPGNGVLRLHGQGGSPYSQGLFIAASSLHGFGAGSTPALQSLALCIIQSQSLANTKSGGNSNQDIGIGELFGALSVLAAIGQMVLGPLLFGIVYTNTVASYPKTIFILATGLLFVSIVLLYLIRPDVGDIKGKRKRIRALAEDRRGRSRVSKDLRIGTSSDDGSSSVTSADSV